MTRLGLARILADAGWPWGTIARAMVYDDARNALDWSCMHEPDAFNVAASLLLDGYPSTQKKRRKR